MLTFEGDVVEEFVAPLSTKWYSLVLEETFGAVAE
jgi:hypothetical protein